MIPASVLLQLLPGTFAFENFSEMRTLIPDFETIYKDREPQVFKVASQTKTHVQVVLPSGRKEWHSKRCYKIVKIEI